jgi:asparagine synthetase B (glutamine-hydrolysing)
MMRSRLVLTLAPLCLWPHGTLACSFLVASFDVGGAQLNESNRFNQRRGPDVTNVVRARGWTFVHNLLSITGPATPQPFVASASGTGSSAAGAGAGAGGDEPQQFAVFNGEVYNYRELAQELTGSSSSFSSDGKAILPAFARWGPTFARRLHGEWSIVVVDLAQGTVTLSTDAFGTKPLWWAVWRQNGAKRFAAASAKSALLGIGAPLHALSYASFNEVTVLRLPTFEAAARHTLVRWDTRQFKDDTSDWISAFRQAVRMRSRRASLNRPGLLFVSMSSGYDSGAIALALHLDRTPYAGYSFASAKETGESTSVVEGRAEVNARHGGTMTYLPFNLSDMAAEHAWIEAHVEPDMDRRKNTPRAPRTSSDLFKPMALDKTAHWMSYLTRAAHRDGRIVHLSGQGGDEILSDYMIRGTKGRHSCSCFGGDWPANLTAIFPWCSFYLGCQHHNLLREEYAAGAHGVEARYPFLDARVVQESLWLSQKAKNSRYKRPLDDFMRQHAWPNMWGVKQGYLAMQVAQDRKQTGKFTAVCRKDTITNRCIKDEAHERQGRRLASAAVDLALDGLDAGHGSPPSLAALGVTGGLHLPNLSTPSTLGGTASLCSKAPADLALANHIFDTFLQPLRADVNASDGTRLYTTDALLGRVSARAAALGARGLAETVLTVFRRYNVKRAPAEMADVRVQNLAVANKERSFWLIHWFGTWVGDVLARTSSRPMVEMVKEAARCLPPLELWSVSHGATWHVMLNAVRWDQISNGTWGDALLRELGAVFCHRELMPWYTDCYHGVGHGIIHIYLSARRAAELPYRLTRQFMEVPMDESDFDSAVALCRAFTYEEAVGCADGVAHSYFVFWPAHAFPSDVVAWCAPRVWAAFCFRTLFHHARLSNFGVPHAEGGIDARVDYINLLLLKPEGMYAATARFVAACAAAPPDVAVGCMWGLMSSGLKGFATKAWNGHGKLTGANATGLVAVCAAPHVSGHPNPALMDACVLPLYVDLYNRRRARFLPQNLTAPLCHERLGRFGARCILDSRDLVPGSKNYARFVCPIERCPYVVPASTSTDGELHGELQSRPHRPDGH